MDVQKIAQDLISKLEEEKQNLDSQKVEINGAIQGINLLFSKMVEEQQKENAVNDESSKSIQKKAGKKK